MASQFPDDDRHCQGSGCTEISHIEYYVKQRQRFCRACASKMGCHLVERTARRLSACEKHTDPVRFYCETHHQEACHVCITLCHRSDDCKVVYLDEVVDEDMCVKLKDVHRTAEAKRALLKFQIGKIDRCKKSAQNHFESVEDKINSIADSEINSERKFEEDEIIRIEKEAEEEIRKVKARMEERKRVSLEESEKRRSCIESRRHELLREVMNIKSKYIGKMHELEEVTRVTSQTLQDSMQKIKNLLENHEEILKAAGALIDSVQDILDGVSVQGDEAEKITSEIERANIYIRPGCRSSSVQGREVGCCDGWEEIASFESDAVIGCLGENEICIGDGQDLHVFDANTCETQTLTGCDGAKHTRSCSLVAEDLVVCSNKYGAWKTSGPIALYDRQWRLVKWVKRIPFPIRAQNPFSIVSVSPGRDGTIVAVQYGQSDIHVIDYRAGKIARTVTVNDRIVKGRISVLSSGDFVFLSCIRDDTDRSRDDVVITSGTGAIQRVIVDPGWGDPTYLSCTVNPVNDMLYVTYIDPEGLHRWVDEVSKDGVTTRKRIVKYPVGPLHRGKIRFTPAGTLVCFNREEVFIFKPIIRSLPK